MNGEDSEQGSLVRQIKTMQQITTLLKYFVFVVFLFRLWEHYARNSARPDCYSGVLPHWSSHSNAGLKDPGRNCLKVGVQGRFHCGDKGALQENTSKS